MNESIENQEELRALAEAGNVTLFLARARHLHPSDLSDIIASLEEDVQLRLVNVLLHGDLDASDNLAPAQRALLQAAPTVGAAADMATVQEQHHRLKQTAY